MSLFTIFKISSQGMTAQRERLEAASSNLANANSTRTAEGGPYRRRDIVFQTAPIEPDESVFGAPPADVLAGTVGTPWGTSFDSVFQNARQSAQGVASSTRLAGADQTIRRFDPSHPDADANGYVNLPDVDPLEETVNMLSAARSFEANATAYNTAKELARATLKLGE